MDSEKLKEMMEKANDELVFWSVKKDSSQINFWLGYKCALNDIWHMED